MPIQPGILFSACLLTACLAANIVLYPEVGEMIVGGTKSIRNQPTETKKSDLTNEFAGKENVQQIDSPKQSDNQTKLFKHSTKPVLHTTPNLPASQSANKASDNKQESTKPTSGPSKNLEASKTKVSTDIPKTETQSAVKPQPATQSTAKPATQSVSNPVQKQNISDPDKLKADKSITQDSAKQGPFAIIAPAPPASTKEEKKESAFAPPSPATSPARKTEEAVPTAQPAKAPASMSNQPEKAPLPVAPSPAYAAPFLEKTKETEKKSMSFPKVEDASKTGPTPASPSWESIDSILQRPVMYDTPKALIPLPPVSSNETLESLNPLRPGKDVKRIPVE